MNNSKEINNLKKISSQVRRDIVRMVHEVQSGHPGGSLGCTDFLVYLFFNLMKRNDSFDIYGDLDSNISVKYLFHIVRFIVYVFLLEINRTLDNILIHRRNWFETNMP